MSTEKATESVKETEAVRQMNCERKVKKMADTMATRMCQDMQKAFEWTDRRLFSSPGATSVCLYDCN